jgi:peptidoglycan/LPS O-acetylase OafA/YrhL
VFCLLGIIAYGVASRYWGNYYLTHPNESFIVPRKVTDFFLFFLYGRIGKYLEDFGTGMLISLVYIYIQRKSEGSVSVRTLRTLSPWLWGVGIFVLFMYAIWHFNIDQHGWPALDSLKPYYNWLDEIMISIGFGACVAAILFGNLPIRRVFEWSVLRWIGLISYSLYIWHLQILMVLEIKILPQWPRIMHSPVSYGLFYLWVLVAVFPFCFGVYIWIEKPWMNLSDRFKKRMTPRSASVPASVVGTPDEADERMMEKEQEEVAI